MVTTSPFSVVDVGKCERIKKEILNKKGFTGNVSYHDVQGRYLDNPYETIDSRDSSFRPADCEIFGNNGELQEALEKNDKQGGIWSTAFMMKLAKNEVVSTDIPVSLASCNTKKEMRMEHMDIFDQMPKDCKVESIHAHNKEDKNPAFHVHLKCQSTSDEVMDFLVKLIAESDNIGRKMCKGVSPKTVDWMF